ncbi:MULTISPECIES: phosphotransferase family protein [Paraburkholderia]|uniref:phosphotransferase family protein n=1 Tax=Paraburkholderia TaxID=1822464 RepID=UPI0038BA49A5
MATLTQPSPSIHVASQSQPESLEAAPVRDALAAWLREQTDARVVTIEALSKLTGGAIQENWALSVRVEGGPFAGLHDWVVRTDSPSSIAVSRSRAEEFALLEAAFKTGATVPEPLWLNADGLRSVGSSSVSQGRSFFVMKRVGGTASGHLLTSDPKLVEDPDALSYSLGQNLARIHSIAPGHPGLAFLPEPEQHAALADIARYRAHLDDLGECNPILEWALRWCEKNAPSPLAPRLIHRDFRTGNYMVDAGRLSGILDWEFAGWGDRREDLGWFTARCWRFARPDREAGGISAIEPFLAGYRSEADLAISEPELRFWQIMAHLRWAVIALQQAARHTSGEQRSLELALTAQLVPGLELEIVRLIDGGFDD